MALSTDGRILTSCYSASEQKFRPLPEFRLRLDQERGEQSTALLVHPTSRFVCVVTDYEDKEGNWKLNKLIMLKMGLNMNLVHKTELDMFGEKFDNLYAAAMLSVKPESLIVSAMTCTEPESTLMTFEYGIVSNRLGEHKELRKKVKGRIPRKMVAYGNRVATCDRRAKLLQIDYSHSI